MIKTLKNNQIIVVGTNLNGQHLGGAAKQAYQDFGLKWGVGEGISGKTYAFPTLDKEFKQRHHLSLKESAQRLFNFVVENPDKEFLLTKVGCGIANFTESYMQQFFKDFPTNLIQPW